MTKEELKGIITLDLLIQSKQRQLDNLNQQKLCVKAIGFKDDKVSPTNKVTNPQEELILRIVDLETSLQKDIINLFRLKCKARTAISKVAGIERVVLEMRYLECMEWKEIAHRLNYSLRAVYKIHGQALEIIKRVQ
ncbi:sigma factor-like helix-turn-helix DNA-binding protein [Peptoniphilus sp.]|jgi:DNA-directed RNA polymerase specialized sigma subunit|uniref:sigma factor-like helix-turn-helix DNA-binding protein n=1 Tax=Peptoniphilus sp. TaxID=1971214 RepID=UPI003D90E007